MANEDEGTMSHDEMTEYDDMRMDALIQLLVDKKIITGAEFDKKMDEMFPDEE